METTQLDRDSFSRVFRDVTNRIAPVHVYGWSDEVARHEVHEVFNQLEDWLKKQNLPWNDLSIDDLRFLGFKAWDEPDEEGNVLMLAPLYLVPTFPNGLVLTGFNGKHDTVTVGKDKFDNDIRFGCIPFGLVRKETKS